MTTSCERWLPVVGYEGLYEVSDLGRVRSMARPGTRGGVLRGNPGKYGHQTVCLSRGGDLAYLQVHRLVLEAFWGPCPVGHETRHLDGDATNNQLHNLRWGTPLENAEDRQQHGTQRRGSETNNTPYCRGDVDRVLDLRHFGATYNEIAGWLGMSPSSAHRMGTGQVH